MIPSAFRVNSLFGSRISQPLKFTGFGASVVAAVIIICIVLYSFLAPLLITSHDATFMCGTYAKKPGRVTWLRDLGIATGGVERNNNEANYIKLLAIGVAAEGKNGEVSALGEAMNSQYQPILKEGEPYVQELPGKKPTNYYPATVDTYLEVGAGKTLTGLVGRTLPEATALYLAEAEDVASLTARIM